MSSSDYDRRLRREPLTAAYVEGHVAAARAALAGVAEGTLALDASLDDQLREMAEASAPDAWPVRALTPELDVYAQESAPQGDEPGVERCVVDGLRATMWLADRALPPQSPPPRWEVEDTAHHFRHRVVCGTDAGEWRNYGGVATLQLNGRLYAAVTAAYAGSLPIERVFEVREVSSRSPEKDGREVVVPASSPAVNMPHAETGESIGNPRCVAEKADFYNTSPSPYSRNRR